jgi:hypothetical protein
MNYYILFPGDTEADTVNDQNHLGDDNGFGVFWAGSGFRILQRLINENHNETLDSIRIFNERGTRLDIDEFLDLISGQKIRVPK